MAASISPTAIRRPGRSSTISCAGSNVWPPTLRELLATEAQVVLAGDYNVMPTELDVYKPERWLDDALFRPEVRAAYRELVAQGWTDALRALHPEERIYTFWDYFRNAWRRNAGLRIDHLLLSPAVAPRLVEAGVDREVRGWEKTSDHAPVWIELAPDGVRTSNPAPARQGRLTQPGISCKPWSIAEPHIVETTSDPTHRTACDPGR